jgi:MFS family permease
MSMLGSRVSTIAFPMLVLYLTGSPVYAGLAVFAATAPSVLFYMPAGALVDHLDPRRTMLVSELLRGLLIGGIVATFFLDRSVPLIMSLAVLEEIAEVFATLAERRYIRMLVDSDTGPDESDRANSASISVETRSHFIVLIGRPLGGLLFDIGHAIPFLADMVSFAVSCLSLLRIGEKPSTHSRRESRLRLGTEIIDGIKYLVKSKYVRDSVILNSWMTLISQALILIFIVESRSQHLSTLDVGVVLASSGLGGVAGAKLGKPLEKLIGSNFRILYGRSRIKIQLCIWSVGLLFLTVFMEFWQVLCMAIVMTVFGFAGAIGNIELETYINRHVPEEMTGRLASIDRLTSLLMCGAGPAIGGMLVGNGSTRTAVWWLFVMALVPTAVVVVRALPRPERIPFFVPSRQAPPDDLSPPKVPADSEEPSAAGLVPVFTQVPAETGLLRPAPVGSS